MRHNRSHALNWSWLWSAVSETIAAILEEARSRIARSINTAMVQAYWLIGHEIIEVEQRGAERAAYGEQLLRFPPMLGWSHYLVLLHVPRPEARSFYEIEAARESWSVRELERQVASSSSVSR